MNKKTIVNIVKRIAKFPVRVIREPFLDIRASYYLKKQGPKKCSGSGKIKVGFIVQMPELWDKQSSVYTKMVNDPDFDVYMIIVPAFDFVKSCVGDYSGEKHFFITACLNGNYILVKTESQIVNLENEHFDYLFYQRPYDHYLPSSLRSSTTVKFTKVCYIPYATPEIKKTNIYPRSFFRNLSFGFMEDQGSAQVNTERMLHNCQKGLQKFLNIGYPTFEKCLKLNKECNYLCFLWTPRWSYDPIAGGSHFMEYNQFLTNYNWETCSLTVRPHPMMWENFIKTGLVNEADIAVIKEQWALNNIEIDKNNSIEDTFDETDVMISDKSSVIPMFFLTGKPVIYCPVDCEYGSLFSTILPGLYIANNWEELKSFIQMLSKQEDPLLQTRKKIIAEYFSYNDSATEKIVDEIKNDFYISSKK